MPHMHESGNLRTLRQRYLRDRPANLTFLFKKRLCWMNGYIGESDQVLEVGCGMGITKLFVTKGSITMSDYESNPWIDKRDDALNLSYPAGSFDVVIANNVVHHLTHPLKFFQEADRVLKKGGRLLIQDINCGFFMRRLLRFMHVEDYDFRVDVFDPQAPCTSTGHHWDGNNAIANLLFDDLRVFGEHVPYFKIMDKQFSEFFIYLVSGGINARTFTIALPNSALSIIDRFDALLVSLFPRIFALQMRIVLEKK